MSNRIPTELMDELDKEMMDMKGISIDDVTSYIIHLTWQYAQKNLHEEQLKGIRNL